MIHKAFQNWCIDREKRLQWGEVSLRGEHEPHGHDRLVDRICIQAQVQQLSVVRQQTAARYLMDKLKD